MLSAGLKAADGHPYLPYDEYLVSVMKAKIEILKLAGVKRFRVSPEFFHMLLEGHEPLGVGSYVTCDGGLHGSEIGSAK